MTADGWTITMACDQFAQAGMPIDGGPARLRELIKVLRIPSIGEVRPGDGRPGRGYKLYPIAELQQAHGKNARWLCPPVTATGDTRQLAQDALLRLRERFRS